MEITIGIIAFLVGAIIGGAILFKVGINYRKQQAENAIGSAEKEAERIVEDAKKEAENQKKIALVEAKDEIHKSRNELEKEIKERRSEMSRQERRMQQKEENLDKKNDNIEKKEEQLQKKLKQADEKLEEADKIKKSQMEILERISQFTMEQAKEHLLSMLENELVHDKALKIQQYETQLKDECEEKARDLISKKDKKRKRYHNYHCSAHWGDSRLYDICINSSRLGIGRTVDILEDYIRMRRQENENL